MPSGAMTLLEAAKTMPRCHARDVIGTYASAYQPMMAMSLLDAPGGTYPWNIENELPYTTGGTRNIDGSYTESRSNISPFVETFKIYGGQVKIDRAIATANPAKVPQEIASQVRARARIWTKDLFEGAGGTALRGFEDWLDNEVLFASQTVNVGTASTGSVLLTDHLDQLLNKIKISPGNTFIYTSNTLGMRANKLSRGTNVSGDISFQNRYSPNQWGMYNGSYGGVPIVPLVDGKGTDILSTDDGDGNSSAVYAVTYGPELVTGFQMGMPAVLPLSDASVYNYFDLEWYVGMAPQAIKSIARLRYVAETL